MMENEQKTNTSSRTRPENVQNRVTPVMESLYISQVNHSFSMNSSEDESSDGVQFYKMENQQVKRQNNFLKKKIQQLLKQIDLIHGPPLNKKILKKKITNPSSLLVVQSEIQFSIDFFFEEIRKLLESFCSLFKVQYSDHNEKQNQTSGISYQTEYSKPFQNHDKHYLQKKLQKLSLQHENKKYQDLLDIFMDYYKQKSCCEEFMKKKVQELSRSVIELSKKVLKSTNDRKMKASFISNFNRTSNQLDNESVKEYTQNKSVCNDNNLLDLSACRISLGKEKMLFNLI